jgi:hypothetical protein
MIHDNPAQINHSVQPIGATGSGFSSTQPAILFSGMIAADPFQGGATWAVLQYLLGFRQLGSDITFVEPLNPAQLRPHGTSFEDSDNARYFRDVMRKFGLADRAALLLAGSNQTIGLSYDEVHRRAARCDVLFNISGMLQDPALLEKVPRRVYLDLDPAFVQLWQSVCKIDMHFAAHTHFVTVAQAIGSSECPVPTCDRDWLTTFQPVVLEQWPVAKSTTHNALTTVGNWRGYGSIEHEGRHYGQKAHSLRNFFELPKLTTEKFVLALGIHPEEKKDVQALRANHWEVLDPIELVGSPGRYREFIQGSKAEFGIAKSGYVVSRCGWFSDRSACYLASGRPVIAQDTGFDRFLPTGEGLFAFATMDEVLSAIGEMNRDYPRHRRAARALAEQYFDSRNVLTRLLDIVGA